MWLMFLALLLGGSEKVDALQRTAGLTMLISLRRVLQTLEVAISQEGMTEMKSGLSNMRNMNLVSLRHCREPPIFSVV